MEDVFFHYMVDGLKGLSDSLKMAEKYIADRDYESAISTIREVREELIGEVIVEDDYF